MTSSCEGYACPPEHSVPSSTVFVVRTEPEQLPPTGGDLGVALGGLLIAAALGCSAAALLTRRGRSRR